MRELHFLKNGVSPKRERRVGGAKGKEGTKMRPTRAEMGPRRGQDKLIWAHMGQEGDKMGIQGVPGADPHWYLAPAGVEDGPR